MNNEEALRELFPKKIMDQSAYSIKELAEHSGLKDAQTYKRMDDAVNAGAWEQVWKVGDSGRIVKAYRPKR